MQLSRYFLVLLIITCVGIGYSHQQFVHIRANYNIKHYENEISQLLDRNKKLMYNITTLESPANLEMTLKANGMDYDMPRRWAVVKRSKSKPSYELAKAAERRSVVFKKFLNFIAVKAEAQTLD